MSEALTPEESSLTSRLPLKDGLQVTERFQGDLSSLEGTLAVEPGASAPDEGHPGEGKPIHRPALHPAQRDIFASGARFRVIAAGRRMGKTWLGAWLCVECASGDGETGGRAWWVAPTYPIASIGWRKIKRLARQLPDIDIKETERRVTFASGGWIQVKSADSPDSLRGEGLDLVVIDEAAFVKEEAWIEALRPALSDRKGRAVFISTPNGRNWFWRLYTRGLDPAQAEWQSWNFPTSANPYIDAAEIESARAMLPERLFRQEYLAEFIEDGGVFRGAAEVSTAEPEAPIPGERYVMGVDLARHHDFTAISILRRTWKLPAPGAFSIPNTAGENPYQPPGDPGEVSTQVFLARFNRLEWAYQVARIKDAAERYGVELLAVDQTGVGDAVIEALRREMGSLMIGGKAEIVGVTFNVNTKNDLIQSLALAIEKREIALLNDAVQLAELQAYDLRRLPSGRYRFEAPSGGHDDTVIALALAWYAAHSSASLLALEANPFWER